MRDWTFGRKLGMGFAFAGLMLLGVAIIGFRSAESLIDNDAAVTHTLEVRHGVADLLSQMKDVETGQRGFVLTGEESYLDPYRESVSAVRVTHDRLRKLLSDEATQQNRLDALLPLLEGRIAEAKQLIEQRRAEGIEAAIQTVKAGRAKELMDGIRRGIAEIDAGEARLLDRRRTDAVQGAQQAQQTIFWGSVFAIVLVVLVGWLTTQSLSNQVGSAVQHVQSASAELQTAANQQAVGAKQQSTAMSEITTTISELLATSRQISESAQRVSQIAEQTANAARSGDGTVEKGLDAVAAIRRQVDVIVGHMLELGKKSQQIGSVLDIVVELAEQTNILAINATIEAAGAGDAGKRFAIVADEIRKLADRVGGSSKEIRGLIEDMRSAVNTTIMTTETGSKAVDAGTRQFADVASSFKQISGSVSITTEAAREITLSTKQQATAVEQINVAVTNVAQGSRETEASTGQTLQTALQLTKLSRELLQLVQPRRVVYSARDRT